MYELLQKYRKKHSVQGPRVWQSVCVAIALGVLWLGFCAPALAEPIYDSGQFAAYLTEEKANLVASTQAVNELGEPTDLNALYQRQKQNQALSALLQVKISNFDSFLLSHDKALDHLREHVKKLQQDSLNKTNDAFVDAKVAELNADIRLNKKEAALIKDDLTLAHQYQEALLREKQALDRWQAKFDQRLRLDEIEKTVQQLVATREQLLQKNVALQQEKRQGKSSVNTITDEAKLLLNNQHILLLQHQISEMGLRKKLIRAEYVFYQSQDIKAMQAFNDTYQAVMERQADMIASLHDMEASLTREKALLSEYSLRPQYFALVKSINTYLKSLASSQQALTQELARKQASFKRHFSFSQSLAQYHVEGWPELVRQVVSVPYSFAHHLSRLFFKVKDNYEADSLWSRAFVWLALGVVGVIGYAVNRVFKKLTQDKARSRLSAHLFDGLLTLVYRTLPHLTLFAGVLVLGLMTHLPIAHYQLLLKLIGLWVAFRSLRLLARLTLLERVSDASGRDVTLYHRLNWLVLIGGWSTALMVYSQQLPLSLLLQDVFSRLFMLFLLVVSVVLWRSRTIISHLFSPSLMANKRYLHNAVSVFVMLMPLTLFTTAAIGVAGFIDLAWNLSRYQVYFLLVITGYVVARGLLFDALELVSEWMISRLANGWLWTEVVLKPLDKITRLLLLVATGYLLFSLYGWHSDSWVMSHLYELSHYPLLDSSGVHITLMSIVSFSVGVSVLIWTAKWTKEFGYRWLYRHTEDPGIRNSLAVFTQYGVIILGGIMTLRILGLDFAGLSMILGGLAVGMGFGLRDFASNLVGGVMLLIERPVREGDLITLGEHEGQVAHIGIRSMRVTSWDNMDILIPNAETFNKPLSNWTHQDNIIRTVVPIKVARADDPILVQQLMVDVLADTPEIVTNPPPQVLLKEIDDALIEFEVRYFINVQKHTRFEVRSKVLFAIMAQFKAANVTAPIPPMRVELSEEVTRDNRTHRDPAHRREPASALSDD